MKELNDLKRRRLRLFLFGIICLVAPLPTYAQNGNSISGIVFGVGRQPVGETDVELLDEYQRTLQRTRTNASGSFSFFRVPSGRLIIRALAFGTSYEAKDEEIEITNFSRLSQSGQVSTGGFSHEQRDIYLRLRKGVTLTTATAVFVQDVPAEAKKLYEKGVGDLNANNEQSGFANLKAALEQFPKYFYALERLGTEYVKRGHYEAAEILLNMAVNVNPRAYHSWYGLAFSQYNLKKYELASKNVEKAVEIDASAAEPNLLSGVLLRRSKDFKNAEKRLLKAKEAASMPNPQIHWELALLYANDLNKFKEAAAQLKLFLKAEPKAKDAEKIKEMIVKLEEKASQKQS